MGADTCPMGSKAGGTMTPRRLASITATTALAAGIVLTALVATPSIAAAISTAHLDETRPAPASAVTVTPAPPVPTPSAPYDGPLIAPFGSSDITRAQLHAAVIAKPWYADDPQNSAIWERQQWITKQCMAKRGFLYDPILETIDVTSLTLAQQKAMAVALGGPRTDAPYNWRTAGCVGLAVHLTGMDGKD